METAGVQVEAGEETMIAITSNLLRPPLPSLYVADDGNDLDFRKDVPLHPCMAQTNVVSRGARAVCLGCYSTHRHKALIFSWYVALVCLVALVPSTADNLAVGAGNMTMNNDVRRQKNIGELAVRVLSRERGPCMPLRMCFG